MSTLIGIFALFDSIVTHSNSKIEFYMSPNPKSLQKFCQLHEISFLEKRKLNEKIKYHTKTHSNFETISVPLCIFCKIQTIELHFLMILFFKIFFLIEFIFFFISTTNNISTIREQSWDN